MTVQRRILQFAVLGLFLGYLGTRLKVLSLGYYNAPGRMPLHRRFDSFEIKYQDRLRSCEDVQMIEKRRIALLACDPGRENWNTVMGLFPEVDEIDANAAFYAYRYDVPNDDDALVPIKTLGFAGELRTIGFDLDERSGTLFVTNHLRGSAPAVEQFRLDLDAMTATHQRTLRHPAIHAPNAIAALSATEFYVSNQHFFVVARSRLLWLLETYLGLPLGTVVHVRVPADRDAEVQATVVARLAYPNGVTVYDGGSKLAVSSTNTAKVQLYAIDSTPGAAPSLRSIDSIRGLPFMPDNIVATAQGSLLIAGHPHLPSLNSFTPSRRICNRPAELAKAGPEAVKMCEESRAGSWVSEWTPGDKEVTHVYSGWEYPTSATAARDRESGVGIVAGLYAKGIMVWRD